MTAEADHGIDPIPGLLEASGVPRPVTEFKFHAKRKWQFDYAWPEQKIALEKEGGVFGKGKCCPLCGRRSPGAHSSVTGISRDIDKYNEAQMLGWIVIRVLPNEFTKKGWPGLLAKIERALSCREVT